MPHNTPWAGRCERVWPAEHCPRSLFTHLDWNRSRALWTRLFAALAPNGCLISTFHGSAYYRSMTHNPQQFNLRGYYNRMIQDYLATGFGYQIYRDYTSWGQSLSSIARVTELATGSEAGLGEARGVQGGRLGQLSGRRHLDEMCGAPRPEPRGAAPGKGYVDRRKAGPAAFMEAEEDLDGLDEGLDVLVEELRDGSKGATGTVAAVSGSAQTVFVPRRPSGRTRPDGRSAGWLHARRCQVPSTLPVRCRPQQRFHRTTQFGGRGLQLVVRRHGAVAVGRDGPPALVPPHFVGVLR